LAKTPLVPLDDGLMVCVQPARLPLSKPPLVSRLAAMAGMAHAPISPVITSLRSILPSLIDWAPDIPASRAKTSVIEMVTQTRYADS
jgi:hypothetical protein